MTTWTSVPKSNNVVAEVDFLFSDGSDFLFSSGADYVFLEAVPSIVWTGLTKNTSAWVDPWNIAGMTVSTGSYDASSQIVYAENVKFSADGTKMYLLLDSAFDQVHQYTLSTAWDVTTASYSGLSVDVTAQTSSPYGFALSSDGTKLYINKSTASATIFQYTLGTPWNISTATYASISLNMAPDGLTDGEGVVFSADGSRFYVVNGSDFVYQYTLGTPWNISTATYVGRINLVAHFPGSGALRDVAFSSDGTKMFAVGNNRGLIQSFTLGTAWDVTTATFSSAASLGQGSFSSHEGLAFSPDGTRVFVIGTETNVVYQYDVGYIGKHASTWSFQSLEVAP